MKTRLLAIGPLPTPRDVVGGTKVSFAHLVRDLARDDGLALEVFDTARPHAHRAAPLRALAGLGALAKLLLTLLARGGRFDAVLFNVSAGAFLRAGPLVALACRARRLPLAARVFGGDLDLAYDRAPAPLRALARRTVLAAPLLLLQTRALCARFAALGETRWLPTTRDLRPPRTGAERRARPARRFVFVGQLRPEKGLAVALDAVAALDAPAELVVYGPPMPGFDVAAIDAYPRATYGGVLAPGDVAAALAECDALVLPTFHDGEGLPGVVVEALQCGLPVVTTHWRALPELVRDGVEGLLVEPRSVPALRDALARLAGDAELVRRLAAGARERGDAFRSPAWHARVAHQLHALAGGGRALAEEVA